MVDRNSTLNALRARRAQTYKGGGQARIDKQHAAGKLTARERLGLLFDSDSFQEFGLFAAHRCNNFGMEKRTLPADGVVTGVGGVDERFVFAASQDFTVAGGTVGAAHAGKIIEVMEDALKNGAPFVFINDSGGARIQEGVDALSGYGGIFYRNILLSGVVPQISVVAGPCAGGAAYSPALTDFIVQVRRTGQLYITGPLVIKEVTGADVTAEELGGVESHGHYSGVVHFIADDDRHAIAIVKRLLSFLPSNNTEDPPTLSTSELGEVANDSRLSAMVPEDHSEPYDMHQVIHRLVDDGDFMEVQAQFAENIIIGFARMRGRTIGIVANQPLVRAGVLDIDSADKASRFIRFCNAFNIPLVNLVDVPGFLPGVAQEYGGIIRHGAKMLFAYGAATVPKVTIILRKAFGGAYLAMCSKDLGADRVFAWPTAQIAVMGAAGAVGVLFREQIAAAANPEAERQRYIAEYREAFANPYAAAGCGMVDDIIEPGETRAFVATTLEYLHNKRELRPQKKHGLIPL